MICLLDMHRLACIYHKCYFRNRFTQQKYNLTIIAEARLTILDRLVIYTLLRLSLTANIENGWLGSKRKKIETLKLCLKNAFRELLSKILFRFSQNLKPSRNSQKNENTSFGIIKCVQNIWEIDKFLGIGIQSI